MKVLLFASNGMLGNAINTVFQNVKEFDVVTVARNNADFTLDFLNDSGIKEIFNEVKPDVVINTAAIINLLLCEKNTETAYRINARFCNLLTDLCSKYHSYFIQISTDHYYINDKNKKHTEKDKISLLNEYARTKYLGECLSLLYDNALVIRTNIIGFKGNKEKPTFLEWVIKSIKDKKKMYLFSDFYTSPIYVMQLANVLVDIIYKHPVGILNIAGNQVISKKDFVLLLSNKLFKVRPDFEIASVKRLKEVNRANSLGLDVRKVESILKYNMPNVDDILNNIEVDYRRKWEYEI